MDVLAITVALFFFHVYTFALLRCKCCICLAKSGTYSFRVDGLEWELVSLFSLIYLFHQIKIA